MVQKSTLNRIRTILSVLVLVSFVLVVGGVQAKIFEAETEYAVIANAKNSISGSEAEKRTIIKQLYLKDRSKWPGGIESKPFGRKSDDANHAIFRDQILDMSESSLAQHWIDLKQKTGETPPRAVKSDSMMIKFVKKYDGAFGVVSKAVAEKNSDVIVVFTFSK